MHFPTIISEISPEFLLNQYPQNRTDWNYS